MIWRNPIAWLGLATLLIPIAIHLLVRQQADTRPFPTLRFILPSRMAAIRRRFITDWLLLSIRIAMLALAVAALADPFWQTAARRDAWSNRTARALVIDTSASTRGDATTSANAGAAIVEGASANGATAGSASDSAVERTRRAAQQEAASAFRSTTVETNTLADGLPRATDWLRTAPPARREIVVLSDFQVGALDASMLSDVPPHVGLRFVRTSAAPATRTVDGRPSSFRKDDPRPVPARAATAAGTPAVDANLAIGLRTPRVTLNATDTTVLWTPTSATPGVAMALRASNDDLILDPFDVRLRATAATRPFARAAGEAVIATGIAMPEPPAATRPIVIIIAGPQDSDALPRDAARLASPWMSDVLNRVMNDRDLTQALARTSVSRAPASVPSASAGSPSAGPALAGSASADATQLARSQSSASDDATSLARSQNAAAPPWLVVARDAGGQPALLAAARATPSSSAAELLLVSRMPAADAATALLIRATLRALDGSDPLLEAEIMTVPDATLAQWQRPATDPPPAEWQDLDSSDRRWLWAAVLLLLALEQFLRRSRRRHTDSQTEAAYEHAA